MNPAVRDFARHSGLRERGFCGSSSVGLTGNNLWIRLLGALVERVETVSMESNCCSVRTPTKEAIVIESSYVVIHSHVSEFPEPMTLRTGDGVLVGERYDGPEGWPDWYFCTAPDQEPGFVPAQLLDRHVDGSAKMLEDFTNRELDVVEGQVLQGNRQLNGWLWVVRISDGATGWVPLDKVRLQD